MPGSITFVLKKQKKETDEKGKEGKALIFLVFYYKDLRIVISTGEKIFPKYWNSEEHRARAKNDFPEYRSINQTLENHARNVMSVVRSHIERNTAIIPGQLKNEMTEIVRPGIEKPAKADFFKAIDEFIKASNKAKGTIVSYEINKNFLFEFSKTLKRPITFESIDLDFYDTYVKWMTDTKKYAPNTIGNRIKTLKVFMSYFLERGYTTNQSHLHKKFRKLHEDIESIYLTEKELLDLYNHDFSGNLKYDRVRDTFIIGCYTGLRFSDLSQLTAEMITPDDTIKIKTIKTGEVVIIPLHWMVKKILLKYDYQLPRVISNQKMNEYLKKIANEVKLNTVVSYGKTQGTLKATGERKKSEMISTHTARRSFATNMYLAGVPTVSIMLITGHRTETAFMKYIKITKDENATQLKNHEFFKKSPLKIAR